ncbi:MAG TPA: NAD-dependent epimerase/dehydratase family protein [Thermotogota bacterium]|nr:NAD-dependent epimerase/dehydratase family protein [Thermotogota bacterium]HRW91672.1 NAD-dependent epimerase/dehydratase family protein [Thermotogota bacterium]
MVVFDGFGFLGFWIALARSKMGKPCTLVCVPGFPDTKESIQRKEHAQKQPGLRWVQTGEYSQVAKASLAHSPDAGTVNLVFPGTLPDALPCMEELVEAFRDVHRIRVLLLSSILQKGNPAFANFFAACRKNGVFCSQYLFFEVYGPWEDSDSTLSCWARALQDEQTIPISANPSASRDWTYVEDLASVCAGFPEHRFQKEFTACWELGTGVATRDLNAIHKLDGVLNGVARVVLSPELPPVFPEDKVASGKTFKKASGLTFRTPFSTGLKHWANFFLLQKPTP